MAKYRYYVSRISCRLRCRRVFREIYGGFFVGRSADGGIVLDGYAYCLSASMYKRCDFAARICSKMPLLKTFYLSNNLILTLQIPRSVKQYKSAGLKIKWHRQGLRVSFPIHPAFGTCTPVSGGFFRISRRDNL